MRNATATIHDTAIERFLREFDQLENRLLEDGRQAWLMPARKAAIANLSSAGFPDPTNEDWKYTRVAPILEPEYASATETALPLDELQPCLFDAEVTNRLVFVNGHFASELSRTDGLPAGATIGALADAIATPDGKIERSLARYTDTRDKPFAALNTALFATGAYVHLPRGSVVEQPIHIVFVTKTNGTAVMTHPRVLLVAENESQARIVESYIGLGDEPYLTNAVTELVVGDNARLEVYKTQLEGVAASHVHTVNAYQRRDSRASYVSVNFGGRRVRNDVCVQLDDEGCETNLGGLSMLRGEQHVDDHLRVDHLQPHCNSREVFRNILDDRAHSVFTGRIYVEKDAQKTDGKQTNMNLLLSKDARAETRPQLEIFADDVKCTHGATIGQIDTEALFYLRSRGIPEPAARTLLVYAFAAESIEEIQIEPLRNYLRGLLAERLPQGETIGALA